MKRIIPEATRDDLGLLTAADHACINANVMDSMRFAAEAAKKSQVVEALAPASNTGGK